MKIILLAIICLLYSIICPQIYSQQIKCNGYGKKMVRSITVDYITENSPVTLKSYHDSYNFDYFPNGELKSVEHLWKSEDGKRTERLFIENDSLYYESTLNGKKDPNVSGSGNVDIRSRAYSKIDGKEYIVKSITKTYKEYHDGKPEYFRIVTMFASNRIYILNFDGKQSLEKELQSINRNPHSLVECEGSESPFPFTNSLLTCGFNGYRLLADGDDGILYTHYLTQEISRTPIGKNYYKRVPNPFVSYENGDIFLNRKNDTNINFQFLMDSDHFELMSDWGIMKSQDLIYKESCFGEYWDRKWDYQFDSSDNIIEIIIQDRTLGTNDFKATIEYVYE